MTDMTDDTASPQLPPPRSAVLRSRRLRWLAPVAVGGAVAAAIGIPIAATASPSLPPRTAAQLLVAVDRAHAQQFSGTVVQTARLGLPALPDVGSSSIPLTSLLAGSRTARVWYGGADRARIALVGNLAETDLIRNGDDVWLWTSGRNTAQHLSVPAHGSALTSRERAGKDSAERAREALSPQAAADQALAAIDPSTLVRVEGTATVAGRSAYELVLSPRDAQSLVREVRLAVDSRTSLPLRVQVFAAGTSVEPALETGFRTLTFGRPDASVFRFTPPRGAKVSELPLTLPDDRRPATAPASDSATVVGTGWTSVLRVDGVDLGAATGRGSGAGGSLATITRAMRPVSGAFGSGRLLTTRLVSVLLLDDGRLYVGAVTPAALERAAGR